MQNKTNAVLAILSGNLEKIIFINSNVKANEKIK
jgi:hypothetical protein